MRPWISSVPSTTAKATTWIRSRPGKPAGRDRAAATVTTPRIPAQPMMTPLRKVGASIGLGSRTPKKWFFTRSAALKLSAQPNRTRITVASTARATRP